jgi:hypothetical protein
VAPPFPTIRRLDALVDIVCQDSRQAFAVTGAAVPAVAEVRHEHFIGFGDQQRTDEVGIAVRFASHRNISAHATRVRRACAVRRNLNDKGKPLRGDTAENLLQGGIVPLAVLQDGLGEIGPFLA